MRLHSNLMLCGVITLSICSASANAQNAWGNYHWARKANPFTLQIIDSVTLAWQIPVETALLEWSYSAVLDAKITSADDSLTTRQNCPIGYGQVRICNAAYGLTGWIGLTSIGVDATGHVDRARARLNDSYTSVWSIPGERNHTACHELGHTLGLDHSSTDGSSQGTCMDYSTSLASQWPSGLDYDTLVRIYGHVDSYNSYATTSSTTITPPPATGGTGGCTKTGKKSSCMSAGMELDREPPMGRIISQDAKEQVWVSPREDGGIWIHHVNLKD